MSNLLPAAAFEVMGFLGVTLYLGSYAALQTGRIRGAGYTYALLNLLAAAFILASLTAEFNLWSAIIQISWIVISIVGMTRYYLLTSRARFSQEEQDLIAAWFPDLAPPDARQLLSAGTWVDADAGIQITTQGEEIGFLYFLSDGMADVSASGKPVGTLVAPSVIGELTCFDGGPASATVTLARKARYFAVDAQTLNQLCRKNPELRLHLQGSLARDTHAKLTAANQKLSAP
jgi:hypothetical protein